MAIATATLGHARRRIGRGALVLAAAALGVGAVAVPRWASRGDDRAFPVDDDRSVASLPFDATLDGPPEVSVPEVVAPAAGTPRAALERFLDAEAAGDAEASFDALSASDRAATPTRAAWTAAHDTIPRVIGYEVTALRADAGRAEADVAVALTPSLDDVVGLVPARATARYVLVAEDGGWRVAFAESSLVPEYAPDDDARGAARAWAAAAARGDVVAQWDGGVLGLADDAYLPALRAARDGVEVGAPLRLAPVPEAEPMLAAFGPDVFDWARVVPLEAPVALDLVLAPVGEQWLVVGVLSASAVRP
jgi:hypothetical protein